MDNRKQKDYAYKQGDAGEDILVTVHLSTNELTTPKPLALYFHGGGFMIGSKDILSDEYPAYIEKMLQLGFIVVAANHRLCPTISLYDGPVTDSRDCYTWTQGKLPALLQQDFGVAADGKRVVTWGHSVGGTLALLMASMANPPKAILDIFGYKYLADPELNQPLPGLKDIPMSEDDYVNQIWKEVPPPSSSPLPRTAEGLNFSVRNAWAFNVSKSGSWFKDIIKDGNYGRVEPAKAFSSTFPPTFIVQGTGDNLNDAKFSKRAFDELKAKGVECELELVEGGDHGFDQKAKSGDESFEPARKGMEFLKAHV